MKQPNLLRDFYHSKYPIDFLSDVKLKNYSKTYKALTKLEKHPFVKNLLYNHSSTPNDYSGLKTFNRLPDTGNLEGEIAWFTKSITKYKDELNKFIALEKTYQRNILTGKFHEAKDEIKRINDDICHSYWSIENSFSIEQKLNGTEGNWAFLKDINSKTPEPYTLFFNKYFSVKSEKDTTVLQYKRELESLFYEDISKSDIEYIVFKLGYFSSDDFTEFSHILNFDSNSSIIDKYLMIIDILFELSNNNQYISLTKEVLKTLKNEGILDSRIDRLLEYNSISSGGFIELNEEILILFDKYSLGDYSNCIEYCNELLVKFPSCIELYEIYIKSLIELNQEFKKTEISEPIDSILNDLYNLYTKNDAFYDSKENLLKQYLSFPKLTFFKQLLSLTIGLTNNGQGSRKVIRTIYFANSRFSNPQLVLINSLSKKIFFNKELLKKHLSLRINHSIINNEFDTLEDEGIPKNKLKIYKARSGFHNNNKLDISLLEELYNQPDLNINSKEEIILLLFEAYYKNDDIDKLIPLLVDSYFINKFLLERINKSSLLDIIIDKNYNLGNTTIDLPIFFFIEDVNSYFLYATLETFLTSIKVNKPSEINTETNNPKLIFLLENICNTDVLNNFYLIYDDDDDVIEERIKVLRMLIDLNKVKSDNYLEEIASLTQKQKIDKIIQTVNDGIISLNFNRIKEDKDYSLESNFNRFLRLKSFSDEFELNLSDTSNFFNKSATDSVEENPKQQDASFISFKAIFNEVLENFLFSKEHGLDGDLSTRIRHGVLENQIRPILGKNHLIAIKETEETYKNINYWQVKCNESGLTENTTKKLQDCFKLFSKSIDTAIITILKEYLQIQSNRHKSKEYGLFNYTYTDDYLWEIYKDVTDEPISYDDFLTIVFDQLKQRTEYLLKDISSFLTNTVNQDFQLHLDKLLNDTKKVLPKHEETRSEIELNINRTKTELERELYDISNWFKITNKLADSVLDIETIVKTAIESINLNNSDKIFPKLSFEGGIFYERGFYYIDIFKILIENAVKHSDLKKSDLGINIDIIAGMLRNKEGVNLPYSKLIVKFSNKLGANVDKEALDQKLKKVTENWSNISDLNKVNNEGGSGLQKIKRMLKFDIAVYNSDIKYQILDSELKIELGVVNYSQNFLDKI